jgi:hypothetical protein
VHCTSQLLNIVPKLHIVQGFIVRNWETCERKRTLLSSHFALELPWFCRFSSYYRYWVTAAWSVYMPKCPSFSPLLVRAVLIRASSKLDFVRINCVFLAWTYKLLGYKQFDVIGQYLQGMDFLWTQQLVLIDLINNISSRPWVDLKFDFRLGGVLTGDPVLQVTSNSWHRLEFVFRLEDTIVWVEGSHIRVKLF